MHANSFLFIRMSKPPCFSRMRTLSKNLVIFFLSSFFALCLTCQFLVIFPEQWVASQGAIGEPFFRNHLHPLNLGTIVEW